MTPATAFTIAAMQFIAPGRDHDELGGAIARRAEAEAPLFADDADRRKTIALLVAVGFRESSLRNDAEGDHDTKTKAPTSFCAFQIHLPWGARTREGWSGADLKADPNRCVEVAFRMLRGSIIQCRALPSDERLAVYARGRCDSAEGQRLSRDRSFLARYIGANVPKPPPTSFFLPDGAAWLHATRRRSDAHELNDRRPS